MKIRRLHLKNFRGIQDMTLEFSPDVTALIGMNGAGKSAVLDALAALLLKMQINFLQTATMPVGLPQDWWQDFMLGASDIRSGSAIAEIEGCFLSPAGEANVWINIDPAFQFHHGNPPSWQQPQHTLRGIPAALHYDVQRAVDAIDLATPGKSANPLPDSFWRVMHHGHANFNTFFNWFREREDDENEKIRDQADYRDPGLQAVRDAISAFTGFHSLRVRRKPQPHLTLVKHQIELSIMQLSDGERSLLALVGDLAHRLALWRDVFPDTGTNQVRQSFRDEAIVLIDEIELHLHPAWQRRVLHQLRTIFPHCQFIITTHSPQVVGELKRDEICLLKDGQFVGHPAYAYGLDSASALEIFMEGAARNPDVRNKLDAIERALEDEQLPQAKQLIEALRRETGDIPDIMQHQAAWETLRDYAGTE
jgi:predicted ATP-binding protein involved in virulence